MITAKNISIDKDNNSTIFENEVVVETQNKIIESDYAKYDKKDGYLILKENIIITDEKKKNFLQILLNILKRIESLKLKEKLKLLQRKNIF